MELMATVIENAPDMANTVLTYAWNHTLWNDPRAALLIGGAVTYAYLTGALLLK
jgi:hypothetical protein